MVVFDAVSGTKFPRCHARQRERRAKQAANLFSSMGLDPKANRADTTRRDSHPLFWRSASLGCRRSTKHGHSLGKCLGGKSTPAERLCTIAIFRDCGGIALHTMPNSFVL
jgi:hypothetical protein